MGDNKSNPNIEFRNTKQIRITKIQIFQTIPFRVWGIRVLSLFRISSLGFSISLLLVLSCSLANADIISDAEKGEELLFARNYDEGIKVFEQIEKDYPESPTGSFGQMAAWQVRMFENQDFRFREEFESAEKRFEASVWKMLKNYPCSWDLFVAGAGYGMRGFYYARDGKWFRALGSAVRAVQILKRLLWSDKDFVDAELGVGMYEYWRSVMTKSIHFLPFFGDHRKDGIEKIQKVADAGKFAAPLAEANLGFIYAQEKDFSKARVIVDKYLKKYPNNIILRQLSGNIFYDIKDYPNAIKEFKKILAIDSAMTKTYFKLGRIYSRMPGHATEAIIYFNEFIKTNPEKVWGDAARKSIKQLQ